MDDKRCLASRGRQSANSSATTSPICAGRRFRNSETAPGDPVAEADRETMSKLADPARSPAPSLAENRKTDLGNWKACVTSCMPKAQRRPARDLRLCPAQPCRDENPTRMIADNVNQWKRAADGLRKQLDDSCLYRSAAALPEPEGGRFSCSGPEKALPGKSKAEISDSI